MCSARRNVELQLSPHVVRIAHRRMATAPEGAYCRRAADVSEHEHQSNIKHMQHSHSKQCLDISRAPPDHLITVAQRFPVRGPSRRPLVWPRRYSAPLVAALLGEGITQRTGAHSYCSDWCAILWPLWMPGTIFAAQGQVRTAAQLTGIPIFSLLGFSSAAAGAARGMYGG